MKKMSNSKNGETNPHVLPPSKSCKFLPLLCYTTNDNKPGVNILALIPDFVSNLLLIGQNINPCKRPIKYQLLLPRLAFICMAIYSVMKKSYPNVCVKWRCGQSQMTGRAVYFPNICLLSYITHHNAYQHWYHPPDGDSHKPSGSRKTFM